MAISVKKIAMWRREVNDTPGALDAVLAPLADSGADLQLVVGFGGVGNSRKASVGVCAVKGKKATAAATGAGLAEAPAPALLVEGDNKPGLGHAFARSMADAGINLEFAVAQVMGKKFSAVFGFQNADDATRATPLLKKAASMKPAKAAAAKSAKPAKSAAKPAAKGAAKAAAKSAPAKTPAKKAAATGATKAPAKKAVAKSGAKTPGAGKSAPAKKGGKG